MHSNQSQETIERRKTHKFLRDRMSTNGSSKTRKHKDDLRQLISLTCASTSSLTHMPQLSDCVCVEMRRASLLFIFFRSLDFQSNKSTSLDNYLPRLTSLGESNNPSTPRLRGLFPLINKEGYLLWLYMTWLHYWFSQYEHKGMNLHDLIILLVILIGTLGYNT